MYQRSHISVCSSGSIESFRSNLNSEENFRRHFTNVDSHESLFKELFGLEFSSSSPSGGTTPRNSAFPNRSFYECDDNTAPSAVPGARTRTRELTQLPPEVLSLICCKIQSQNDLVSVSRTCSTLNRLANRVLYRKIMIVEPWVITWQTKTRMYLHDDYTYLKKQNLASFLLKWEDPMDTTVSLIQELVYFVFDTAHINDIVYKLYTVVANGDINFIDKSVEFCDSPISFQLPESLAKTLKNGNSQAADSSSAMSYFDVLHEHARRLNKVNLYEQLDSTPLDSHSWNLAFQKSFESKQNNTSFTFYINDFEDVNILPHNTKHLYVLDRKRYFEPLKIPKEQGISVLEGLDSLYFTHFFLTNEFLQKMPRTNCKLQLQRLSLTNRHCFITLDEFGRDYTKLNFEDFKAVFDLRRLKQLEVKLSCFTASCGTCLLEFFESWNSDFATRCKIVTDTEAHYFSSDINSPSFNNFVNIEKLSLISRSEAIQMSNAYNQHETLVVNYLHLMRSLKYLFLDLNNDYFVYDLSRISNEFYVSVLDRNLVEFLKSKAETLFASVLKLKQLKELDIVDFYKNWILFLDVDFDSQMKGLSFLNTCGCAKCHKSRKSFHEFSQRFNCIKPDKSFIPKNVQFFLRPKFAEKYYDFYFFLVQQAGARRFPVETNNHNDRCSHLDVWKYPFNEQYFKYLEHLYHADFSDDKQFYKYCAEKVRGMMLLLIHSSRTYLHSFGKSLPNLETLLLGGLIFHFERSQGSAEIVSIYENYREEL